MIDNAELHVFNGSPIGVRATINDIPADETITKAWFTVKERRADPDPGLIQKIITTTHVSGGGQIEDAGANDETATVRFELTIEDTTLILPGVEYPFDIQVLTSAGDPLPAVDGKIWSTSRVTQALS